MKIAVLMGGISSEREVSLKTGNAILNGLKRLGYDAFELILDENNFLEILQTANFDLAYIALHGEFGEDGRVQAILDILKKPYTGSGFTASAVSMDKELTKIVAKSIGIEIPKTFEKDNIDSYPVVIKPATEGSSVGLFFCNNIEEVNKALDKLKGRKIVIEECIVGKELTVGILNNKALGVLEIIPKEGRYDYDAKYITGDTIYEYPAKIDTNVYDKACKWAEDIHKKLELSGVSRSDFLLTAEKKIIFLEVNTVPGMTETSLLPKLATLKGYTFDDILKNVVDEFAKKV